MTEGNNEITVAAFDLVPNTSDGIKAVIVVDTAVPDSIITSKPNNPSNSNTADFVFTATETGSSFQCQLDKGGYTACASPMNYTGLAEGDHTFSVTAIDAAGNVDETPDSYTWAIDTTPPSSTIAAPKNGDAIMTTTFTIKGTASDTGSGIQRVEISTDGGSTWNLATGTNSWSYIWTIPADGTYTIKSRATDAAGNVETPGAGIQVTVDKTAPALIISTLSDGSWTNNQTLNVAGTATDNIGMQSLTINGTELTINPDGTYSHAIILQIGANAINIIAEDLAGNQTTDTRTVNFDPAGPVLLITLPPDNIKTKEPTIQVEGAVDETSVIDISVNNEPYISVEVLGNNFVVLVGLSYGINNIELMATDRAGNTSSVKRTVTYDNQNPALSVTLPDQDIKTNQESIVIRGEVTDLTTINVTITMDGNTYTPVITGGVFEQTVTFTTEKTYNIYVTATDEAGNQTTVQRNVIYDRTAPILSIDPVTSPTSQKTQVLTGTVESGLAVTITCSTATVGAVIYPSLTTWTVTLTNMTAGDNQIAVSSIDTAGNISTVTVSITLYATYRISGGAYFYPESPTYKASFSMDVTTGLTPSGWLKYYYARTRMNFVSTSITHVTVSGNTATISGTGTVNGASGYTFTARVTDGVPDSFGITINKPDGSIYYSAPTKAVSGGDLIISLL
jgi:hypothetical protein